MSSLQSMDGGPPVERCKLCRRRDAAGPCARCRSAVCGDCCELSTGGATPFAVCLSCVRRGGATLTSAWVGLLGWLGAIVLVCVGLGILFMVLRGR